MYDLTLPLDEGTIRPAQRVGFEAIQTASGELKNFASDVRAFSTYVHTGTHIDAPIHYSPGGKTIDQLDVSIFCGPARVFDMRAHASKLITADILDECNPGISPGDRVVLLTGDIDKQIESGDYPDGVYVESSSLSPDGATWLVEKQVSLVVVDFVTESVDASKYHVKDPSRPVHVTLLDAE
ncbi:MAG TPA: cyclase family protein, partial [Halobacteriales archaeon]|nr:cyclase family protein [Halobacteriales archaeon]